MRISGDLLSTKTTWLGLAYLVKTVVVRYYPAEKGLDDFIDALFAGLALIFVRDAIAKNQESMNEAKVQNDAILTQNAVHEDNANLRAATVVAAVNGGRQPAVVIDTAEEEAGGLSDRLRRDSLEKVRRDLTGLSAQVGQQHQAQTSELAQVKYQVASLKEPVQNSIDRVRVLETDMRAALGPFRAVRDAFHNIALVLKAARLDRMEKLMSEQTQQLMDALAGNEPLFIELTTTIGNEAAQVTAEMEALRGQVAPNLQPAIESVLSHQQKVVQAIAAIRNIAPDVIPEPEPVPAPTPEPAPERRGGGGGGGRR